MSHEHTTHPHPNPGSGAALGLGIAGLVIGILALLFSFIPCFGMYAIYPGVLAVALAGVGLGLSLKANRISGLSVAGLCVALVGCGIAGYQWYLFNKAAKEGRQLLNDGARELRRQADEAERRRKEREAKKTRL